MRTIRQTYCTGRASPRVACVRLTCASPPPLPPRQRPVWYGQHGSCTARDAFITMADSAAAILQGLQVFRPLFVPESALAAAEVAHESIMRAGPPSSSTSTASTCPTWRYGSLPMAASTFCGGRKWSGPSSTPSTPPILARSCIVRCRCQARAPSAGKPPGPPEAAR